MLKKHKRLKQIKHEQQELKQENEVGIVHVDGEKQKEKEITEYKIMKIIRRAKKNREICSQGRKEKERNANHRKQ